MKEVYIFGHRRPDTDSVTSAIALSYLKNKQGANTKPVILDNVNKETEFVLKYFNVKAPDFINDVRLRVEDVNYYEDCYITEDASINKAYEYMKQMDITGVPIVTKEKELLGLVTVKMIGNELVSGNFTHLKTSYNNLLEILNGKEILRFNDEIDGNIVAAAFRSETILNTIELNEHNIMIVGDRHAVIEYAIENKVQLLLIVGSQKVKTEHIELAKKNKVNIISTSYDTFHTSKLIGLANYVKTLISSARVEKIDSKDYLENFMVLSSKQGYNNYPIVVDGKNKCGGLIRVTDIKNKNRTKVILVDHNESTQSAIGLDDAEILEIVDHHKIGDLTTNKPINFRNMTVGSTNTIVYMMYKEASLEIPKNIAGIMLSGILSDTLNFTSPTTTELDKEVAHELAGIAGVDKDKYVIEMFKAGTKLDGKTIDEIITEDMKVFPVGKNKNVAISQVLTLNSAEILEKKEEYVAALDNMKINKGYTMVILSITDIIQNGSFILYDTSSEKNVKEAMDVDNIYQGVYINEILSRKKQIVPKIMRYMGDNK